VVTARERDVLSKVAAEIYNAHEGKPRGQLRQGLCGLIAAPVIHENQLSLRRNILEPEVVPEDFQILLTEFLRQIGVVVNRNDEGVSNHMRGPSIDPG